MTQEDQNLQSLFANLNQVSRNTMIREKVGGGTGGGSDVVEGSMNPNTLMTGNPYIAKNVVEFNQGGMVGASGAPTMNNPYLEKMNALVGLQQMVNVGKGLANNVLQQEAMMSAPKAAYGMKRKYQEGGNFPHNMYHPETGYKIVAQDKAAHTKLAKAGFGHTPKAAYGMKRKYVSGGMYGEEPKAAYGMKRKYDQGGLTPYGSFGDMINQVTSNPKNYLHNKNIKVYNPATGGSRETAKSLAQYYNPTMQDQYTPTPMANKGMKMKKRYTNGGRF